MRESDIRLSGYPMNSTMYRSGQATANEQFAPNMYAMSQNYRLSSQQMAVHPGQFTGQSDTSLQSGPQSLDASGMMPPQMHHYGPQSLQPAYYPNRFSFNPADGQLGPQSYPSGPGQEHTQQTQQPQQYSQPTATVPHQHQHQHQFAQPSATMNQAPQSLNYANNGDVAGAQYGQIPAYYGQQPNPSDTTVWQL